MSYRDDNVWLILDLINSETRGFAIILLLIKCMTSDGMGISFRDSTMSLELSGVRYNHIVSASFLGMSEMVKTQLGWLLFVVGHYLLLWMPCCRQQ